MYKNMRIFIYKTMIVIIITLLILIFMKSNREFKNNFYKYVYDTNLSFTKINKLYEKYFNNIISLPKDSSMVFNEKLTYTKKSKYYDGVSLSVNENYLIPIQDSGLVVYIGEKEHYGNVVIIQQTNGIDMWYGNINQVDVKLYDYVEKGSSLGECSNNLYIVYKKNGEILDYDEYI